MARFDLALLIILIFHDRNRFFNHQSRRTHLIHSVDERGSPSKGCIRNGIISLPSPTPSRGRNIFFARLFTDPANNRENATRIIIWASRGVLSPARDEKRRVSCVCVRKVCAREFFFFLFFPPLPPFFSTRRNERAHTRRLRVPRRLRRRRKICTWRVSPAISRRAPGPRSG